MVKAAQTLANVRDRVQQCAREDCNRLLEVMVVLVGYEWKYYEVGGISGKVSNEKNREKQGRQNRVSLSSNECRSEIPKKHEMPANRIALYNGILRDRVHRMS